MGVGSTPMTTGNGRGIDMSNLPGGSREMKLIPEHVIISDTIERNGYREVTLRTRPKVPSKSPFGFFVVEGGMQRHPELADAWKTGIEVVGEVTKGHIVISSIRPLTKDEKRKEDKLNEKLWRELV